VDNTVFGEKYNQVLPVLSSSKFVQLIEDGYDSLTLLCLHVKWSNDCVRTVEALNAVAPTLPYVRFVTMQADHFEFVPLIQKLDDVYLKEYYHNQHNQHNPTNKEHQINAFPTFLLIRGNPRAPTQWTVLEKWSGHLRTSERINQAVVRHLSEPLDVDTHRVREEARAQREKDSGEHDDEEEEALEGEGEGEEEELQWIWNSDQMGGSMLLGNYGKSVEFVETNNANDPSEAQWQWGWKNNQYNYDPSVTFKNFDPVSNESIEQWWKTGG
jgi:hypothetical protein